MTTTTYTSTITAAPQISTRTVLSIIRNTTTLTTFKSFEAQTITVINVLKSGQVAQTQYCFGKLSSNGSSGGTTLICNGIVQVTFINSTTIVIGTNSNFRSGYFNATVTTTTTTESLSCSSSTSFSSTENNNATSGVVDVVYVDSSQCG